MARRRRVILRQEITAAEDSDVYGHKKEYALSAFPPALVLLWYKSKGMIPI